MATAVASDVIARSFEQKLGSSSVRNTTALLTEEGHIFQTYVFPLGISPGRVCRYYGESLPETPQISFKVRDYVNRDSAQIDPDIGAWSDSCAAMSMMGLKRTEYLTDISGVRHLSAPMSQKVLVIQRKSAE